MALGSEAYANLPTPGCVRRLPTSTPPATADPIKIVSVVDERAGECLGGLV